MTTIATFGNCQARGIASLLELLLPESFPAPTFFSNNVRTGRMQSPEEILAALGEADMVVFQPLRKDHGPLSESSVRASLGDSVTQVRFPYIFNSGVAGFCHAHNAASQRSYGKIFGGGAVVQRLEAGAEANDVIEEYLRGDLDLKVRQRFDQCMERMEAREQDYEIPLADYIRANFRDRRLFLMHNHPSTTLYAEILERLRELTALPIDLDTIRASDDDNLADHTYETDNLVINERDASDLGYTFGPDRNWREAGPRLIRMIADEWERDRPGLERSVRTGDPTTV